MKSRCPKFDVSCDEHVLYRTGKSIYTRILLVACACGALCFILLPFGMDDESIELLVLTLLFVFIPAIIFFLFCIKFIYDQKDNEVQITDRGVYWYVDGQNGFIAHENVERYGFHAEHEKNGCTIFLTFVSKDKKIDRWVMLTYTKYSLRMVNEILSKYNNGQQLQGKPKARWDYVGLYFLWIFIPLFVFIILLLLGIIE